MTTRDETIDLAVCADCIQLIANGELPIDDEPDDDGTTFSDRVDKEWPTADGWHLGYGANDDVDGDLGFYKSPCDGCGSRLHGDRYGAHAFRTVRGTA